MYQCGFSGPWTNPDGSPATVFVNPPYGRGIHRWIEKAICSNREGATVVLLVPARTDSVWFQQLMHHADEIRLLAGRITFVGAPEPAPFPSAVVVLRSLDWTDIRTWERYRIPRRHDPARNWRGLVMKAVCRED